MALRDATTQAKHHTSRHDCRSAAPLLDAELAYPVELATGKEAGGEEVTLTLTLPLPLTLTLPPP